MYKNYNIFTVLTDSIAEFDTETISVIPESTEDSNRRYLGNGNNGYKFSQRDILNDIDMAYNSIYKNGKYDKEGQRKAFLNVVRFYVQVAIKNTNPNISDYNFSPTDYSTENLWAVWFTKRQFANFVRDEGYGKIEDDLHVDFCKYGSAVAKKIKDDVVRVPLRALRCDQGAENLLDGIKGGTPLTIEHQMSYVNYCDYKDVWQDIDMYDGKRKIYEMYTYMTKADLMKLQNQDCTEADYKEMVLTMSIIMPTESTQKEEGNKYPEALLFIEQIDELPFEEVHSEKQDGRWLGLGNVEKQLENQIARNTSANMRRRSMMWSSKNIFQTQGDAIGKNLVKNVQDGEILQVGLNGLIQKVDTTTRGLSDYAQDEQIWEDNGQKQSFSFEAATGETMNAGTPFRLGAMLSNSVMGYFDGQKEIFGRFRENLYYNLLIPIFKKRAKDDMIIISQTEEGYKMIRELFVDYFVNDYYAKLALSEKFFDTDVMEKDAVIQMVTEQLSKHPELYVDVTKEMYKNAKYNIKLDLSKQTPAADTETLTNLYATMSQKGDPRAEKVLEVILAQSGKILSNIAGSPVTQQAQVQSQSTEANPMLNGLTPQQ